MSQSQLENGSAYNLFGGGAGFAELGYAFGTLALAEFSSRFVAEERMMEILGGRGFQ